uniref:Major facilitator superfamily (MFS) profile domain-containing protein n=1 Tax=Clytia hemisphaerica TaxID=252671 RepID=A0A7M5X0Y2_9CNID|eukprot:TCONS_00066771-protein
MVRSGRTLEQVLNDLGVSVTQIFKLCILLALVITCWLIEANFMDISYTEFQCKHKFSSLEITIIRCVLIITMATGSLVFGLIADIKGRVLTMKFTLFLYIYFRLISIAAGDILWEDLATKIIIVFTCGGFMTISLVHFIESLPSKTRSRYLLLSVAFGLFIGTMLIYLKPWIKIPFFRHLILLLPGLLVLVLLLTTGEESIRYLNSTGDFDQVVKKLNQLSDDSRQSLPEKITMNYKNFIFGSLRFMFRKRPENVIIVSLLLGLVLTIASTTRQIYALMLLPGLSTFHITIAINNTLTPYCQITDVEEQLPAFFRPLSALCVVVFLILAALSVSTCGTRGVFRLQVLVSMIFLITLCTHYNELASNIILYLTSLLAYVCPWTLYLYISELLPTHYRGVGLGFLMLNGNMLMVILTLLLWNIVILSYKMLMILMATFAALSLILGLLLPNNKFYINSRVI